MSVHVLRGKGKPFPYNGTAANSPDMALVKGALAHSLPQRGRVPPTRATGEGERDGTAMWK